MSILKTEVFLVRFMNSLLTHIRELISSFRVLVSGVLAHLLARGRKSEKDEYCHVCHVLKKPLQIGRYMIRTGPRAGALVRDPLPELKIFVCNRHHPDYNLDGALWAGETQEFLKKLDVAVHSVYFYHHNRQ